MITAKIEKIAFHLPSSVVDNEQLVREMGLSWTAEDIYNKTGIRSRHIAKAEERASDLAYESANKLFLDDKDLKGKIDGIIFCSQSSDYILPSTAPILQARLGLSTSCLALDINQGCSGFIQGLAVAKSLIETKMAHNVLLLTAETYSKYIAKGDKATRTIFGDGAAACLIGADTAGREYINNFVFGTDGRGSKNLMVADMAKPILFMDGPEIFQFTLQAVPKTVKEILAKAKLNITGIDYFIFHQANAFILEHLRSKLKIPKEKFFIDLETTGNTVSASIPIALKMAQEQKFVKRGMKIMLVGFGVGYSWGGCIVEI